MPGCRSGAPAGALSHLAMLPMLDKCGSLIWNLPIHRAAKRPFHLPAHGGRMPCRRLASSAAADAA